MPSEYPRRSLAQRVPVARVEGERSERDGNEREHRDGHGPRVGRPAVYERVLAYDRVEAVRAESRGLTARQAFERVAAETGRPVDAVEAAYEHVAASGTEGEGARLIRAFRDAEEALRAYVDGLEDDRRRLDAIRHVLA